MSIEAGEEGKTLLPKLGFTEFHDGPGWKLRRLGDITPQVAAGGTPDTSKRQYWGGEIRWMNSGELNLKQVSEVEGRITENGLHNSSTRIIPARCVLIGLAGQGRTRGTVAMNLVPLCINQSIAAIFPDDKVFDSDYLFHNLDFRYDELRRLSAGGEGRGGLNLQIIKQLLVPLPSLTEQRRIAECLTSLDTLIAAEGRRLEALRAHKKALMQNLFPREGESRPRLRFPNFHGSHNWVEKKLGAVADVLMCKRIFANETAERGDVPFYKIGTIGGIPDAYISRELFEEYKARYNYPRVGEILITCSGTVGKCLLYDGRDAYYQDSNIVWIDNPREEVSNGFLLRVISSVDWGALNTTTIARIYSPDLKGLLIKFPEDLVEQRAIADCFGSLDGLITAQSQCLEALRIHKNGLMQGLFPSWERA